MYFSTKIDIISIYNHFKEIYMNYKSIKDIRKKANLTQIQISNILGMSERNYRAKENGKLPFSQLEMMKIIQMFDLEKEELYELFYLNAFETSFWKNDLVKCGK